MKKESSIHAVSIFHTNYGGIHYWSNSKVKSSFLFILNGREGSQVTFYKGKACLRSPAKFSFPSKQHSYPLGVVYTCSVDVYVHRYSICDVPTYTVLHYVARYYVSYIQYYLHRCAYNILVLLLSKDKTYSVSCVMKG